jgi:hypothetical protein
MEKLIRPQNRTTIEVKIATRDFLASIGKKNESYDKLVLRLAQAAVLCQQNHHSKKVNIIND